MVFLQATHRVELNYSDYLGRKSKSILRMFHLSSERAQIMGRCVIISKDQLELLKIQYKQVKCYENESIA